MTEIHKPESGQTTISVEQCHMDIGDLKEVISTMLG